MILVNGTDDPINPVEGGDVGFWGMSKRGQVISAQASASYFARLAGYTQPVRVQSLPASGDASEPWLELFQWQEARKAGVELVLIHGGGHKVPQPYFPGPRALGRNSSFNGPEHVWRFFRRSLGAVAVSR